MEDFLTVLKFYTIIVIPPSLIMILPFCIFLTLFKVSFWDSFLTILLSLIVFLFGIAFISAFIFPNVF